MPCHHTERSGIPCHSLGAVWRAVTLLGPSGVHLYSLPVALTAPGAPRGLLQAPCPDPGVPEPCRASEPPREGLSKSDAEARAPTRARGTRTAASRRQVSLRWLASPRRRRHRTEAPGAGPRGGAGPPGPPPPPPSPLRHLVAARPGVGRSGRPVTWGGNSCARPSLQRLGLGLARPAAPGPLQNPGRGSLRDRDPGKSRGPAPESLGGKACSAARAAFPLGEMQFPNLPCFERGPSIGQ